MGDAEGVLFKLALRVDARGDPRHKAWEVSARAAGGLRSQSKIAAQESAVSAMGGSALHEPPTSTRFGEAR